jgi:hypothetical protein
VNTPSVAQCGTAARVAMPVLGHRCVGIESEGAVSGADWAIAAVFRWVKSFWKNSHINVLCNIERSF